MGQLRLRSDLVVRSRFDFVVDSHSDLVICLNLCFIAMEISGFSFVEVTVRDCPDLFQLSAVR